jgi:hypothetical protein
MAEIQFIEGYAAGFQMCVPQCFQTALQKNAFRVGDTLYDTPKAYQKWSLAVSDIQLCVTIIRASPGEWGSLEYEIHRVNPELRSLEKAGECKTTQAEFIELLKNGSFEEAC